MRMFPRNEKLVFPCDCHHGIKIKILGLTLQVHALNSFKSYFKSYVKFVHLLIKGL